MKGGVDTHHVVVLTGGTSGIGRLAAKQLASDGITVGIIGRDQARGEALVSEATHLAGDINFHQADLATQATVRTVAEDLCNTYSQIDALVHNAGLSARRYRETEDGIELTFAVNHLAAYLLTHELMDRLSVSEPSRIVVTASDIHRRATFDFDDLQLTNDYSGLQAYARSKLANIAFTIELASRIPEGTAITANCFHPGFIPSTNLFRDAHIWTRFFIRLAAVVPGIGTTQQNGAHRLCHLITDPAFAERTGTYVSSDGITNPSTHATNEQNRERLWNVSADLVGVDSDWP